MTPFPSAPALPADTFLILRYLLTATLFLYLPYLGIVVAGSAASLFLDWSGRENRDERSLRLSREWMEAVTVHRWVLLLWAVLPYPVVVYACRRILEGQDPLPAFAWFLPLGALLPGSLLLSAHRSAVLRPAEPPAPARAGTAGLLATAAAAGLLFLLLGVLVDPAKLSLIRSNPVFVLSWNALVGFLLFLAMSFGLAGGIVLRFLDRPGGEGRDSGYDARVRAAGAACSLAGALSVPALVILALLTLPATGLSAWVFLLAGTVPVLAFAVFALLRLAGDKEKGRPGDGVSELFLLIFLAVILCYQTAVANAFQGRAAPPVRPAALAPAGQEPAAEATAGTEAAPDEGKKVFDTVCSACHRFDARVVGPPLKDVVPKYKEDVEKLKAFLREPVKVNPAYPAMPKPPISEDQIDAVARYLLSTVKGGR